ncbi:MAG: lactate utilization protein B/C, partial [Aestuariibaculum sp.]
MSLFKKIFGLKTDNSKEGLKQQDNRGKYMPEEKPPLDEMFMINFKQNGGKFLYCENLNEVYQNLNNIFEENNWTNEKALILDNNLYDKFKSVNINRTTKESEAIFLLTTCEKLISNDVSLLISSKQILEKKLHDLPKNLIVFATTSQIVDSITEGLRGIKAKNKQKIPTN